MANRRGKRRDPTAEAVEAAEKTLRSHAIFGALMCRVQVTRREPSLCPPMGWAVVTNQGVIHVHPGRRAPAEEWVYVLAHCLLHLGLGHFGRKVQDVERAAWNGACDVAAASLLKSLKVGRAPQEMVSVQEIPVRGEDPLLRMFREQGVPEEVGALSTAGEGRADMVFDSLEPATTSYWWGRRETFEEVFGHGVARAVAQAIDQAGGRPSWEGKANELSHAQMAKRWFIGNYPLLGALAAGFEVVEKVEVCRRMEISVAAVSVQAREIYMNPGIGMGEMEARFVMAHELLHVGLRHEARCMGRDAFLWNVACDYVINGWLIEMEIGEPPRFGMLHDPELAGLSAESVYDRLVGDMRRVRKLATLRGVGLGDILPGPRDWWAHGVGVSLDDWVKRCMAMGLTSHLSAGRGLLPAGLEEEIRGLSMPPVPWDVELARWFDERFPPVEKRRTYVRLSRRQSATPEIPRPCWAAPREGESRTFGVVLDTSGSMDRVLLAKALGAIAGYAMSREVRAVRVVFCDAAAYDQGYMAPEEIGGRVRVRGRGGTVLQPGVDLLEKAEDFPKDGPLLLITDGLCDRVRIARDNAVIVPKGARLPFEATGPVFRVE